MKTETETRYAATTATWCLTFSAYADEESFGCVTAEDHDHYNVVLDQHGKVLFRYWPIGTTFRTPDGTTMRLRRYTEHLDDLMRPGSGDIDDAPARPVWDGVSPRGGAFGDSDWLPRREDVIVEYVLAEGQRPAVMALFMRPNGEAWRLRGYRRDWTRSGAPRSIPDDWVVNLPGGATTTGTDLPEDARLVWHP